MTKYKAGDWRNMTLDELAQLITEEELETAKEIAKVTPMNLRTVIMDMLYSVIGRRASKGFNPENLTFDGVEIKEGDTIKFAENFVEYNVERFNGNLYVSFNNYRFPLEGVNVIAHYPAKDKELERLEGELQEAKEKVWGNREFGTPMEKVLDRYYQARLALEEYKAKNK
jgi:hypothetical protein